MQAFEIFFDGLYLTLIIFLGIKTLLIKDKDRLFVGAMALLLGLGDSFHLIPRMLSNAMANGFEVNKNALFLGTRISAITMSVFYLLFYFYIVGKTKKRNKIIDSSMIVLFVLRIITVFWSFKNSDTINLVSNVPFVIMGLIDIVLLFNNRKQSVFKNLYIYVFFSFLFYVPVVLLKTVYPMIGLLMIPKTIMYVLITLKLYSNVKGEFKITNILEFSFSYLLIGILAGAFYREFGKIYPVTKNLALVHTHTIILGFAILTVFYLIIKNLKLDNKKLQKILTVYNFGIYLSFTSLFIHGLVNPYKLPLFISAGLVIISGIGHILLTVAFTYSAYKILNSKDLIKQTV